MPRLSYQQFPFGGGFHGATGNPTWFSAYVDSQDCVNLYPETGGPDVPAALIGTPGVTSFCSMPFTVRALYAGNARLFAVAGTHVYEVSTTPGTGVINDYGAMSGSPGTGPAKILANGNDLIVVDGNSAKIFFVPGAGPITQPFSGFFAEYMDTFYVALSTANANQVNVSNSLDGSTWNALNFAVRTGVSDFLTGVAAINGQLWLLGQKNTEVWYNAGNPTFPFQRIQGATINVGCLSRWSIAKAGNTIYWLGGDDTGFSAVYRTNGLQPERVSTPAVEAAIASAIPNPDSSGANFGPIDAFVYSEAGHTFYVLSFGNVTTAWPQGLTLAFDIVTGQWHRRGWFQGGSFKSLFGTRFASLPAATGLQSTLNLIGYGANIWQMNLQQPIDPFSNAIVRVRAAPHIADLGRWTAYRRFELDADIIVAATGLPSTGVPVLDYSNDGGRTFQNGTTSYNLSPSGASGQGTFQKYYQNNVGRSRKRVFRITYTSSTDLVRFANAFVDVQPGAATGAGAGT